MLQVYMKTLFETFENRQINVHAKSSLDFFLYMMNKLIIAKLAMCCNLNLINPIRVPK